MLEIVFFHSAIRGEMTFLTEMFINFLDAMENPDDMPVTDDEYQTIHNDFMSFAKVLRAHNAAEDRLLFPVIIARNPSGREALERLMVDHLHIGANIKELLRLMDLYFATPDEDGARLALLRNLVTLIGRLRIQIYAHLYREETVLQSLMAGKMSPEEKNMIVGRIMGHRSSELMEIIIRLLYRHLPKAELEVCLEIINKSVSGTYFERWLSTLSGQLETRTDNADDNVGTLWASHSSSEVAPTCSEGEHRQQQQRRKKKRKRHSSRSSPPSRPEEIVGAAGIDPSLMDTADPGPPVPDLYISADAVMEPSTSNTTINTAVAAAAAASASAESATPVSSSNTSDVNNASSDGGDPEPAMTRRLPSLLAHSSAPSQSSAWSNEEEALPFIDADVDLDSERERGYQTDEIETHKAVAKLLTGAPSDFIQKAIAKVRRDFESAPVATIQHIIEMVTGAQKELQQRGLSAASATAALTSTSSTGTSTNSSIKSKIPRVSEQADVTSVHIHSDAGNVSNAASGSTDIESSPTSGGSDNTDTTDAAPEDIISTQPSDSSLDKHITVTGSGGIILNSSSSSSTTNSAIASGNTTTGASNDVASYRADGPTDVSVASSRSGGGGNHRSSRFKVPKVEEAVVVPVITNPEDLALSYFDADAKVLGCKHYRRKCKLIAPCCGRAFVCRLCHDDAVQEAHILDRCVHIYTLLYILCIYVNNL